MTEAFEPTGLDVPIWPRLLDRQLASVSAGAHICAIFATPADRLRVLVAFFGGGLRRGEQCLYFADPERAQEITALMQALEPTVRTELDRGAMVVVSARDQYVRDGHFQPEAMLELQHAMTTRARRRGFSGVRIASDMSWVFGADMGNPLLFDHAAGLNNLAAESGRAMLCQIDGASGDPVIRAVLRTHPIAIIGERVRDNVFYEPPDPRFGARPDWTMRRLEALARRGTAVFDLGRLILEGGAPGAALREAPALIAAGLLLDCVQLFEFLPLGQAVRLVGSSGVDCAAIGSVEPLHSGSLLAGGAVRAGEPVVIHDLHNEIRLSLPVASRNVEMNTSVGIVIGVGRAEHLYGFLSAYSTKPRIFSEDEILMLEAIGHLLACAFGAARSAPALGALIEHAPDVILRFDGDLHIVYANPAVERVTGIAVASVIGKKSGDLGILDPLVRRWELVLDLVWRTGREQTFELTMPTPTGERVFDSRIVPEAGPDGAVQALLTISRDVTQQRRAEADRAVVYEQLVAQQNQVQELLRSREHTLGQTATALPEHLNARERHILRLLAAGYTNRQIGPELGLTAGTIKNHVARILSKLNVADRTQAAVRAVVLGLVDSDGLL